MRKRIAFGILALVFVFAAWLAWDLITAKSQLGLVRGHIAAARAAITQGDGEAARAHSEAARFAAQNAKDDLDSIPCRLVAAIPFLGSPVASADAIANTVDAIAKDVVPPLVDAGDAIDIRRLRVAGGGIDLAKLSKAQQPLATAVSAMGRVRSLSAGIPNTHFAPAVESARAELRDQVAELDSLLANAQRAAQLLPSMLGADGPRTYFVAFQTNAELRGTGGLIGGSALLKASQGHVEVDRVGSNREFGTANPGVDFGPEFNNLYAGTEASSTWYNANISPHFPYAAQTWREIVRQNWGETVDGVIAVDPVALSYLLAATGPALLPNGEKVTADNVVKLTESDVYARFDDQVIRKQFLTSVAQSVLGRLAAGAGSLPALVESLGKATGEGRVMAWSARPDEEKILADSPLGHVVPELKTPYANVAIVNSGPSKLDYYLRRELTYSGDECKGQRRATQVTLKLTNTAPAGLPDYVARIQGIDDPSGTNLVTLYLYATEGADLKSLTINGDPITDGIGRGTERGHPVFYTMVALLPNVPVDVQFKLSEPIVEGPATLAVQPLVENGPAKLSVPSC